MLHQARAANDWTFQALEVTIDAGLAVVLAGLTGPLDSGATTCFAGITLVRNDFSEVCTNFLLFMISGSSKHSYLRL